MNTISRPYSPLHRGARGFTLVELMVAMAVGLMVMLGLATLFSNVSRNQNELERSIRTLESARYSVESLSEDVMHAGYYSDFNPDGLFVPVDFTTPDPCAVDVAQQGWNTGGATIQIPVPAQGIAAATAVTCLANRRSGTEALTLRMAENVPDGAAPVLPERTDNIYIQLSHCDDDGQRILVAPGPSSNFTLQRSNCTDVNPVARRLFQRTYYIANCNNCTANDSIPTLKRVEMIDGALHTISIAEGVENLQFEYGLDTDRDGQPEQFVITGAVANWNDVVAIRMHLLARGTETSPGHVETRTYRLGPAVSLATPTDGYKRTLMTTTVRLVNVGGRRE